MKKHIHLFAALTFVAAGAGAAIAQGTAFTYQGRLADNGVAANGSYDLQFAIFNAPAGGSPIGSALTTNAVAVSNGLFAVTLDYGANFPGADRWLEVAVRTNGDGAFTTLSPRQKLTATPYAVTAGNVTGPLAAAQLTGTVPAAQLGGTYSGAVAFDNAGSSFTGNGTGLTNVNAATLSGLSSANFWRTTGNPGTTPSTHFLGTTDNQPLEIKVNGLRALRIENNGDGAPNLIGGSPRNFVAAGVVGATIVGGGATNYFGFAYTNSVLSAFGVVGGGRQNAIASEALFATIAGGSGNGIGTNSGSSVIGGGAGNAIAANSPFVSVAGGFANDIGTNSYSSAIGGGNNNNIAANCYEATIAGGTQNDIGVNSFDSTIGGGNNNNIAANSYSATIAGGEQNDIVANSAASVIGGGFGNNIASNSLAATIAGGENNRIAADSRSATIAGGRLNDIGTDSQLSTIGGGYGNNIAANSPVATIAGGDQNDIGTNSAGSTLGGGFRNNIAANSTYATIPGGVLNGVGAGASYALAAGRRAQANHPGAFVWADSTDVDFASTATNQFSIRAAGGVRLDGATSLSFGTTTRQMINLYGTEYGIGVQDFTVYQRTAGSGGNGFAWFKGGTHTNTQNNPGPGGTVLMTLGSGGLTVNGTFVSASDRNAKQEFAAVDSREVLEKVAKLPIQTWKFKADASTRHVGPMAQDFYAAFGVGPDDKHIATVDADGVALAAIQGLNQKLHEELGSVRAENAELRQELAELRDLMNRLNQDLSESSRRSHRPPSR